MTPVSRLSIVIAHPAFLDLNTIVTMGPILQERCSGDHPRSRELSHEGVLTDRIR